MAAGALVMSFTGACAALTADDRPASPSASASAVRTDREPIARRFPALGNFRQVHWLGGTVGETPSARDAVPGPTTYWIEAAVVPAEADYRRIVSGFAWNAVPRPEADGPLSRAVDFSGEWATSPDFWTSLAPAGYSGTVYLNRTRRFVYLTVTID